MVNPQLENGYFSLATELVDQFCHYRLSGEEWLVLWAIFRKTYCWHKKEDKIALSTFAEMTQLKRPTVLRALQKLSSKKIIDIIKKDDRQPNTYRFNKCFDTWSTLSKKITLSSIKITPVIKKDNELSSKKIHSIDSKDTIQKKGLFLKDKNFVQAYNGFKEMRRSKKKPLNGRAEQLVLGKLDKQDLETAIAMLDEATEKGWSSVFERKEPETDIYQKAIKILGVIKYGTPTYGKKVWRGIDLASIQVAFDSFYPDQMDLLPNGTAQVLSNLDEIKKHLTI